MVGVPVQVVVYCFHRRRQTGTGEVAARSATGDVI